MKKLQYKFASNIYQGFKYRRRTHETRKFENFLKFLFKSLNSGFQRQVNGDPIYRKSPVYLRQFNVKLTLNSIWKKRTLNKIFYLIFLKKWCNFDPKPITGLEHHNTKGIV